MEDGIVPVLIRFFIHYKRRTGNSRSAEKHFVFVLDIQGKTAERTGSRFRLNYLQDLGMLIWRKLKNDPNPRRKQFPADNTAAERCYFFPVGINHSVLGEDILCVRIKKFFINPSVYRKRIECSNRRLGKRKSIESVADKKLGHKSFDVIDFQCKHSMILLIFCALSIIKQNRKKEQSFYKKSFQTVRDMII